MQYANDISSPISPSAANNLYVANVHYNYAGTVTVYASHGGSPLRTISQGVKVPYSLAFDSSQNLYVANYAVNTVTVYAPGGSSVLRTISQGMKGPTAIAFNPRSGNLFVSDQQNNTVTVYRKGSKKLLQTIDMFHAGNLKSRLIW